MLRRELALWVYPQRNDKLMSNWQRTLVRPEATLREVIQVVDTAALKIALVVDGERKLLGTVSDGDIRRGILAGCSLDAAVTSLMNTHFLSARPDDEPSAVLALMKQRRI